MAALTIDVMRGVLETYLEKNNITGVELKDVKTTHEKRTQYFVEMTIDHSKFACHALVTKLQMNGFWQGVSSGAPWDPYSNDVYPEIKLLSASGETIKSSHGTVRLSSGKDIFDALAVLIPVKTVSKAEPDMVTLSRILTQMTRMQGEIDRISSILEMNRLR